MIATSPQFFCGWAGVFVSRARRVPFVLEVRDLWPESIAAVGAMRSSRLLRFLGWLEQRMYAAATRIVTVGRGYQQELEARGVPAERIAVIPNGVDRDQFDPGADGSALRARYAPKGEFLCSYVGTIGMGSGLSVVLRAARAAARAGASRRGVAAGRRRRRARGPRARGARARPRPASSSPAGFPRPRCRLCWRPATPAWSTWRASRCSGP